MTTLSKIFFSSVFWAAVTAPGQTSVNMTGSSSSVTKSPDRVQLGDVEILGEANHRTAHFSQRNSYDLKEKIHLRQDFMDRVKENVPAEFGTTTPKR